jgi:hypothetical protein
MNPNQDWAGAIEDFKRGGWIVAMLGGAGVLARILISDEKKGWVFGMQRVCAGSIVGVITYFALYNIDILPIYKSVILATSGAFSPELFKFVLSKLLKYGKRQQ